MQLLPRRRATRRAGVALTMALGMVVPAQTGWLTLPGGNTTPHPVKATVQKKALTPAPDSLVKDGAPATTTATGEQVLAAAAPVSTVASTEALDVTSRIALVGVTWQDGIGSANDSVELRTKTDGTWSPWQALETEADVSTGARGRPGTDGHLVIGAQQVQARYVSRSGALPTGIEISVVDPGESDADALVSAPTRAGAAQAAADKPAIHPRSDWGANESIVNGDPAYGRVSMAIIHHTAGSNYYSQADVPGILRGIQAYHINGRGWKDIGYNFLVDKYGGMWEGRQGGMHLPVIGAQTLNYNQYSTGISVLGDYTGAEPPWVAQDAVAQIIAWKFSIHGVQAWGQAGSVPGAPNNISGHRDLNATGCPGDAFYARMNAMREAVANKIAWGPASTGFSDVPSTMIFAREMQWMKEAGISTGWAQIGTLPIYKPADPLRRDAMAAFLYRLAGSPAFSCPGQPFADVPPGTTFYNEICWMRQSGVATGWEGNGGARYYGPGLPLKRDAMAAFLYRYAGSPAYTPPAASPFADVETSRPFSKEISWMLASGVSTGWVTNGVRTYRPDEELLRDSMAAFMYRFASRGLR